MKRSQLAPEAAEWQPFSARTVVGNAAFELPVNKPVAIPLAPARTRSSEGNAEGLRSSLGSCSSPFASFGTSGSSLSDSIWLASDGGSLPSSPLGRLNSDLAVDAPIFDLGQVAQQQHHQHQHHPVVPGRDVMMAHSHQASFPFPPQPHHAFHYQQQQQQQQQAPLHQPRLPQFPPPFAHQAHHNHNYNHNPGNRNSSGNGSGNGNGQQSPNRRGGQGRKGRQHHQRQPAAHHHHPQQQQQQQQQHPPFSPPCDQQRHSDEFPQEGASPQLALSSYLSSMQIYARATILFHGKVGDRERQLLQRLRTNFTVVTAETTQEALARLHTTRIDAVVTKFGNGKEVAGVDLVKAVRERPGNQRVFVAFFSRHAARSPCAVTSCTRVGASVVSESVDEVHDLCVRALKVIGRDPFSVGDTFQCPLCQFDGLMEDELCDHVMLFHGGQPNKQDVSCPVCGVTCRSARLPFPVHVHKAHGAVGRARQAVPRKQHHTYIFTLVVCQRRSDGKFLIVNEPASWGWWLPGGRVEWGEGLRTAAIRETREEAGVDVTIEGILKVEYASGPSRTRQRVIFYANPVDDDVRPKCVPDYESRGACWVDAGELDNLPLRGDEPKFWFNYIANGGQVFPTSLLSLNRDEEDGDEEDGGEEVDEGDDQGAL